MEGGTLEVALGATHQGDEQGGRTHAHLRDIDPTLVPGLAPRRRPGPPVLGLPLGTGPLLSQMTVTSKGEGRLLGHLLGSAPSLPSLETEVQPIRGPPTCRSHFDC